MLNVIVRSVATILVGILLIMQREAVLPIIVQCIGAAFILPGLFALVSYLLRKNNDTAQQKWQPTVTMLTSIGSIVFGLWLLLTPEFFVGILMMFLGIMVSLLGLYQITILILARKYSAVPFIMFIMPITLLVVGLAVLVNPFDAATIPFLLLGIGAVVGGVSDLVSSLFIIYSRRRTSEDVIISIDDINRDAE